jgi:hypothetical protein
MKVINKTTGVDVSGLYLKLMKKEITNREFEIQAQIPKEEWK